MALKSTSGRYGTVAITIHWTTALLILALIILGLNAAGADTDATKRALLIPHIVLGLLTLALTLFRIIWWFFADKRPAELAGIPQLQSRIAATVHLLAYGFIIVLASSGIATNLIGGVIPALASGAPLPDLDDIAVRDVHALLARLFMALLAIHIGAALYHHFIRRDGLLARMGIGKLPH
ncbi:cytochrome b [Pelagibacterium sp.]|uniref:cytochrome b n=1 Tax=Pelagibacterium sp. TaxID=1967288 RepID=UPI003A914C98